MSSAVTTVPSVRRRRAGSGPTLSPSATRASNASPSVAAAKSAVKGRWTQSAAPAKPRSRASAGLASSIVPCAETRKTPAGSASSKRRDAGAAPVSSQRRRAASSAARRARGSATSPPELLGRRPSGARWTISAATRSIGRLVTTSTGHSGRRSRIRRRRSPDLIQGISCSVRTAPKRPVDRARASPAASAASSITTSPKAPRSRRESSSRSSALSSTRRIGGRWLIGPSRPREACDTDLDSPGAVRERDGRPSRGSKTDRE